MTDGGKDGVGGVAGRSLEIAAAEVTFSLHVADHRLDGGAAPQLALDGAEDAALLPRDEDAMRVRRIVTTVTLIDMDALDLAAGEPLGVLDGCAQRVSVVRVAGQRLGVKHELAARSADIGGDDGDLDAELVGRAGLALADAFDLGGVEGIELPAALALLLRADLAGAGERPSKCLLQCRLADDFAAYVADDAAEPRAQDAQLPAMAVELLGVGVAARHHGCVLGDAQIGLPQPHRVLHGQAIEPLDRRMQQLGVGRESDRLGLHRGIDRNPGQILRAQRAARMRHAQALGQ